MVRLSLDPLRLRAEPGRVVIRPFQLAWQASGPDLARVQRLCTDILALDSRSVRRELRKVLADFGDRHWQIESFFDDRFAEIEPKLGLEGGRPTRETRRLIGAYFCHEYSYAAAALMNPSVVPHPDQTGLDEGCVRIVLSLRAVGEGHISTIVFREGILAPGRKLTLMPQPPFAMAALLRKHRAESPEDEVTVYRHRDSDLSGTVIFPVTEAQRNGLEDLRMVEFHRDSGKSEWIGTYTAYSGRGIRSELMRTRDFREFTLTPLTGRAARNKGMALFPRKIDGKFWMIGRQDGKNLYLMSSTTIDNWDDEGQLLLKPRFPWEFIQIGNCGAPIELDEGWLVLTHGVGAMRKYSIGAALLDKIDPSKVLARSSQPILSAADEDRQGYVPNVVYTCGAIRIGDDLFMPYGIADSAVCFSFVSISDILASMEWCHE